MNTHHSDPAVDTTDRPGRDALEKTTKDLRTAANQRSADVAEAARAGADSAREQVSGQANDLKELSRDELSKTATALETAASELEGSPAQQHLFREAAHGLGSLADALQGRSVEEIVGKLADTGRRNPVAYLGGAALAGFAIARFARASASDGQTHHPYTDPTPPSKPAALGQTDPAIPSAPSSGAATPAGVMPGTMHSRSDDV